MPSRTSILILLLALAAPLGAAETDSPVAPIVDEGKDCANNGVIIQASLGTSAINCEGECTNNGVIVQASGSTAYSCDGGCTNNGVIVWGPRADRESSNGCQGNSPGGWAGACVAEACTPNCNYHACDIIFHPSEQGFNSASLQSGGLPDALDVCTIIVTLNGGSWSEGVDCGNAEDCAIMQNPGCWTVRLTCTMASNYTRAPETLEDLGIHCTTW